MSVTADYPLLTSIDDPADLRQLPESQLVPLANELRQYLIHTVAQSGGHFAAGLGAIELTLALHYVFDTPEDRLVWDVGHQAYPHKILTGRRERLGTIRQLNGLAPFPKRTESPYDAFGVGHSSTSISAALGMAIAAQQQGSDRRAVAIIGDGGMTAGMAFEALNHAGDLKADVLVILNDNEMSISPNVGAVSSRLTKMLSGRILTNAREGGKQVLRLMPTPVWELARRAEAHVKGMLVPGILFEEFGFNYFGPVDGHDLPLLVQTLRNLRQQRGPRLLHILTRKGKGYERAEAEPVAYHGVSRFDPTQGLPAKKTDNLPTYTQVFGEWLCDIAERDHRVVGVTPAMCEGSGMVKFSQQFPDRYFDVGIAEQHSVTVAAGMACDGLKPVVAIYSTFLQRAYDQLLHDVAIQNLPVLFAIDRAGLVGPDGQTHAGSFDLSYLRCIPNMVIMTPADENETRQMLYTGHLLDGPAAVRYPRCKAVGVEIQQAMTALPLGKAERRRQGHSGVALLAFGPLLEIAEILAEEFDASVVNMRFVKPLDESLILDIAAEHDVIVTLEENAIMGGAGSAVSECLATHGIAKVVHYIGLPDRYIDQGSREQALAAAGLDIDSVRQRLQQWTHHVVTLGETE